MGPGVVGAGPGPGGLGPVPGLHHQGHQHHGDSHHTYGHRGFPARLPPALRVGLPWRRGRLCRPWLLGPRCRDRRLRPGCGGGPSLRLRGGCLVGSGATTGSAVTAESAAITESGATTGSAVTVESAATVGNHRVGSQHESAATTPGADGEAGRARGAVVDGGSVAATRRASWRGTGARWVGFERCDRAGRRGAGGPGRIGPAVRVCGCRRHQRSGRANRPQVSRRPPRSEQLIGAANLPLAPTPLHRAETLAPFPALGE